MKTKNLITNYTKGKKFKKNYKRYPKYKRNYKSKRSFRYFYPTSRKYKQIKNKFVTFEDLRKLHLIDSYQYNSYIMEKIIKDYQGGDFNEQ